jgi:hypothetical protein
MIILEPLDTPSILALFLESGDDREGTQWEGSELGTQAPVAPGYRPI